MKSVVELQIYDVAGRVVQTLRRHEREEAGQYRLAWDGLDDRGNRVGAGIYFYRLTAGRFTDVRRVVWLR